MAKKKIAALGGDGVGPEVMKVTCGILEKAGLTWTSPNRSAARKR